MGGRVSQVGHLQTGAKSSAATIYRIKSKIANLRNRNRDFLLSILTIFPPTKFACFLIENHPIEGIKAALMD